MIRGNRQVASSDEAFFLLKKNTKVARHSSDHQSIYEVKNSRYRRLQGSKLNSVGRKDEVTVVMDCDEWKVTLHINGTSMIK